PLRSRFLFLLGVALLFSIIGFVNNIMNLGRDPALRVVLSAVACGVFGSLYAVAGFSLRDRVRVGLAMVPIFVVQTLVMGKIAQYLPTPAMPAVLGAADIARLSHRLQVSGAATILAMALGYASFAVFAGTEGRRHFRVQAEMDLAAEIHQVLVPPVEARIGGWEFYGRSQPSGEVGGDLVDVVEGQRGWVAYIADVSGHGVAPGVVMGMVKSAARMQLTLGGGSANLLPQLNTVLYPLKKPNMFVTLAYLAVSDKGGEYSLAGHPPILHYHAASGQITELECPNLPVGILEHSPFDVGSLQGEPGDVFVLITDGLLEVENRAPGRSSEWPE
ncbi:MAG TPA: SpoIIE family protein phosphatase, partial [Terriglobales bacterium]|nr:SpoIIE family protein phosphatase [Terriglobales bacterium]